MSFLTTVSTIADNYTTLFNLEPGSQPRIRFYCRSNGYDSKTDSAVVSEVLRISPGEPKKLILCNISLLKSPIHNLKDTFSTGLVLEVVGNWVDKNMVNVLSVRLFDQPEVFYEEVVCRSLLMRSEMNKFYGYIETYGKNMNSEEFAKVGLKRDSGQHEMDLDEDTNMG